MEAASSVSEVKGASLEKHCPEGSHLVPSPVPQIPAGDLRSWHLKAWLDSQSHMSLHLPHWMQNQLWWNSSAPGSSPVLAVMTVVQGHLCERVRETPRLHSTQPVPQLLRGSSHHLHICIQLVSEQKAVHFRSHIFRTQPWSRVGTIY